MTETGSAPLAPEGLAEDLRRRHGAIVSRLAEMGASCLVVIRDESVTYLTGYTTMTWKMYSRPVVAVLARSGRLTVVAAETEVDSVRLRVPGAEVRSYVLLERVTADMRLPDGYIQFAPHAARVLGEVIEDAGPGVIAVDGLDAPWPPIGQITRLVPGIGDRTVDASELVWNQRLYKSEWELDRMRAAAEILEVAYAKLREQLRPGLTELEIAQLFSMAQFEAGAHEVGPLGVVAGPDRGLFGFPTQKVWDADDLLYVDGAAIVDGYWSDFCRTFAARPVRPDERAGYARVRGALQTALAVSTTDLTAATLGSTMAAAMEIQPDAVGFGRFGHGIGILVPEPPSLHEADPTPIGPGMTLCFEPTAVHAGINFVAEEEYVVTSGGFEPLSPKAPDEIIRL